MEPHMIRLELQNLSYMQGESLETKATKLEFPWKTPPNREGDPLSLTLSDLAAYTPNQIQQLYDKEMPHESPKSNEG